MKYAILLNKKGEIEQVPVKDARQACEVFYLKDTPELYRKIVNAGYHILKGSSDINSKLKAEGTYFKNAEVVNAMHYSLSLQSNIVSINPKQENLEKLGGSTYHEYNLQASSGERGGNSSSYIGTLGLKYTYGIEIETAKGRLPLSIALANQLNVACMRDGSIAGGEYVTGVLQGDAGLIELSKLLDLLRTTTSIDHTCGIHVHIGNANFNKAFTVFSYILGLRLEKEVFKLLPKSRTNNEFCDYLSKIGCSSVEELVGIIKKHGFEAGVDICYDKIYSGMSYGDKPDKNHNKLTPHKYGRYCGKYNSIPINKNFRYKWLNIIPFNFNMKRANNLEEAKARATIEFRNHSASLSFLKIKNWVLFCMSFVNFVENHQQRIIDLETDLTIENMLEIVFGNRSSKLITFFNSRKEFFQGKDAEKEEYLNKSEKTIKKKKEICVS